MPLIHKRGFIVTGGIKTYTTQQNTTRYGPFYGQRQTTLESCESGAPYNGYFKFLKVRIYNGNFSGVVVVKFVVNGSTQGDGISVPALTSEDEFSSTEIITFSQADLLAVEVNIPAGTGSYRLSTFSEAYFMP